ncbi:MAG: hypothetical protein WAN46_20775 [Gammaproteobacteria bacterium]
MLSTILTSRSGAGLTPGFVVADQEVASFEASVIRAATTQAGPENLLDPTIDADLFACGRTEVRARLTAARRARPQGHPS